MAGVNMAALRSTTVKPGDKVVVIGMGLVGNFAAQLLTLAGAEVMAVDSSEFRLAKAKECGITNTVLRLSSEVTEQVVDWTDGARAVVEAVGKSEAVRDAVLLTRRWGETIILGSPRAPAEFDVTPMLFHIHVKSIRLIGAFEWGWPVNETERTRNIVDNYRLLLDWIRDGRLQARPLMTHILSPKECQQGYDGLTGNRDEFLSVVFDWGVM